MNIIDIHTHGIGGFDTRSSTIDDILRIAEIHGASGVSEIVLSIYSAPIQAMRQQMELVRRAMERQDQESTVKGQERPTSDTRLSGSATRPIATRSDRQSVQDPGPLILDPGRWASAARILGVHLEGPFLNPAKCGALDPASFIDPTEHALQALVEGFESIVRMVTVAPERQGAPTLIKKMSELGIVVSMGHSDATHAEAEAGFHAGARGITHLFNAMRAFHHREPGLAGFGLLNEHVWVEVIADPVHLHIRTLELIFGTKKSGKIILISDSVRETGAAGDKGRRADTSGRLQGGTMTVTQSAFRLVRLGFDETAIRNTITLNPRQYLMLEL
jgi:N-acetylglucosamine-6-phosphate deacetylase